MSYKLPKGFPEHGMNLLHGKQYINHIGLCWLADTKKPGWNSQVQDYVERMDQDGMPIYVQMRGRVWDETTSHEAIGDASISNTKMRDCLPRIADTRWKNRALRMFVGWNEVTYEEIKEETQGDTIGQPVGGKREELRAVQSPSDMGPPTEHRDEWLEPSEADPTCPVCKDGTGVWDNRDSPKRGTGPHWSCKKKGACKKGGTYGWGSWDPDFFAKEARAKATDEAQATPTATEDSPQGQDVEEPLPF